jgi:hypothetical protein
MVSAQDVCFPGWNSGEAAFQALFGRLAFCTPLKRMKMSMVFPLPSDFQKYLLDKDCKVRIARLSVSVRS